MDVVTHCEILVTKGCPNAPEVNAFETQLLGQFSNRPFDGTEQRARSDAVSNGDIGVANR